MYFGWWVLSCLFSCWILWPVTCTNDPFNEAVQYKYSLQRLDQCFCELQGQVDDCCCDVETVDSLNSEKVYPLISTLVEHPYFKFYQVNLNQPCPFWPDDVRCVMRSCHVEECKEEEIPEFVRDKEGDLPVESCYNATEGEQQLSTIDSTLSLQQQEDFKLWEEYDDTEDSFCEADADNVANMSYVDLTLNPERYTGYSGHSSDRIWKAIYQENCFRPNTVTSHPSTPLFEASLLQGMCLEKRAFYRIISGMHASINTHLSAIYLLSGRYSTDPTFGPNLNEFVRRFDAATTSGQGPSWLKNLYFAYLLVLRAISKMEPYWSSHHFYTGNKTEDAVVREKVMLIIQATKGCSSLFDETMMFTGNTSQQLKSEFKAHFKNITRIMECVGCDKCRLWGKLQVHGIGTALKVLFSDKRTGKLELSRREIVALFNVLGRFSSSINYLQMFKEMQVYTGYRAQRRIVIHELANNHHLTRLCSS